MTVLSEDNHLGLTFESSLRNSGRGFSAKATLFERMFEAYIEEKEIRFTSCAIVSIQNIKM
jgi:hypothetical protein